MFADGDDVGVEIVLISIDSIYPPSHPQEGIEKGQRACSGKIANFDVSARKTLLENTRYSTGCCKSTMLHEKKLFVN